MDGTPNRSLVAPGNLSAMELAVWQAAYVVAWLGRFSNLRIEDKENVARSAEVATDLGRFAQSLADNAVDVYRRDLDRAADRLAPWVVRDDEKGNGP